MRRSFRRKWLKQSFRVVLITFFACAICLWATPSAESLPRPEFVTTVHQGNSKIAFLSEMWQNATAGQMTAFATDDSIPNVSLDPPILHTPNVPLDLPILQALCLDLVSLFMGCVSLTLTLAWCFCMTYPRAACTHAQAQKSDPAHVADAKVHRRRTRRPAICQEIDYGNPTRRSLYAKTIRATSRGMNSCNAWAYAHIVLPSWPVICASDVMPLAAKACCRHGAHSLPLRQESGAEPSSNDDCEHNKPSTETLKACREAASTSLKPIAALIGAGFLLSFALLHMLVQPVGSANLLRIARLMESLATSLDVWLHCQIYAGLTAICFSWCAVATCNTVGL